MMRSKTYICAGLLAALSLPAAAADLTLVHEGQSNYVIVVVEGAVSPERTAAKELQNHLLAVTGVLLPIVEQTEVPDGTLQIVVGPDERLRQAEPPLDMAALGADGIILRTEGQTHYLAGGRPRGTLNAVFTFLEEVVGCRWWTSTESDIPSRPTLTIPPLNTVYVPQLKYRVPYYRSATSGGEVFAARIKTNGSDTQASPEYGGYFRILGWCHTFDFLMPPGQYFADHPEWYPEIDGQRVGDGQLCLTNEAMRAEMTNKALAWIIDNPTAESISISSNDKPGWCQCKNCRAVVEEEGALSGLVLRFVNAVAEDIEKHYPNILVETIAYSATQSPPKLTRPRPNVLVRLCGISIDQGAPLAKGKNNRSLLRDLKGWSKISPQLFIWDYVTNFTNHLLPHPNIHTLGDNIRTFTAHKATGLFSQGDTRTVCGDLPELRTWLLAHLMWDPARNEHALIAEFLRGYYGDAVEPMQQYLDLRKRAVELAYEQGNVGLGTENTIDWLTLQDLAKSQELFERAAELVQADPVLSRRVRRARMPIDCAWLMYAMELPNRARLRGEPPPVFENVAARVENFITTADSFKEDAFSAGAPFSTLASRLRGMARGHEPTRPADSGSTSRNTTCRWVLRLSKTPAPPTTWLHGRRATTAIGRSSGTSHPT